MVTVIDKKPSKEDLKRMLSKAKHSGKGVDLSRYAGKIKAKSNPLALQRKLRDEWD